MTTGPSASRPAPPVVPPVEYKGVRYEQEMQSYSYGGDQPGGYLVAKEAETDKRLWMIKVYNLAMYHDQGLDDIGLYFTSMRLIPEKNALEIRNEAGASYLVDLQTRNVTVLFEPNSKRDVSPQPPPLPPLKHR